MVRKVVVMLVAAWCIAPFAAPLCSAASSPPHIPPGDQRKPLEKFELPSADDQDAIRKTLRATQRLSCDSAASLVYRADVIVFAAHEIVDDKGRLDPGFWDCGFDVTRTGLDGKVTVEHYPILPETLDIGPLVRRGEATDGVKFLQDDVDDWAVVRLARPVAGIEPYALADERDLPWSSKPGTPLVTVSPITSNWHGEASLFLAARCRTTSVHPYWANRFPAILWADCYSGPGASGGAALLDLGHGRLPYIATMIVVDKDCAVGAETCTSSMRRLDPDLIARIRGTSAIVESAEDAKLQAAQARRLERQRAAHTAAIGPALERFYAKDDAVRRTVAELDERIRALAGLDRQADVEKLSAQIDKMLDDLGEKRLGTVALYRMKGDLLRAAKRPNEAFSAYGVADTWAEPALASYFDLRLGETDPLPGTRRMYLRRAYQVGGRSLFQRYATEAEIPDRFAKQ